MLKHTIFFLSFLINQMATDTLHKNECQKQHLMNKFLVKESVARKKHFHFTYIIYNKINIK